MRINIDLDDDLLAEAQRLTQITTKKELIHYALQLLVKQKKRKRLTELMRNFIVGSHPIS